MTPTAQVPLDYIRHGHSADINRIDDRGAFRVYQLGILQQFKTRLRN